MRKSIKLTRAGLREVIKESVGAILSESGDTKRGQYMLGRLLGRAHSRGDSEMAGRIKEKMSGDFDRDDPAWWGYKNQTSTPDAIQWNYKMYRDSDMDKLVSDFQRFSEQDKYRYNGTRALKVPIEDIIQDFEDEVLGHECPSDVIERLVTSSPGYEDYDEDGFDEYGNFEDNTDYDLYDMFDDYEDDEEL